MPSSEIDDADVASNERSLLSVLSELGELWQAMGAPISISLAAGLSREEIEALAKRAGLTVPAALCEWWGWHNGTDPLSTHPDRRDTGTTYDFLSLEEALAIRARLMAEIVEPMGRNGEIYWRSSWLPFAGGNGWALFVDTAKTTGSVVVHSLCSTWEEVETARAGSLTEVAEAWLHVLTRGWVYRSGGIDGGWNDRPGIPLYMRTSGLI